jgi:glucokinase
MPGVIQAGHTLGLDLGGTTIKGGIVRGDGKVVHAARMASDLHRAPARVLDQLVELVDGLRAEADKQEILIRSIGLSSTIDADPVSGRFKFANYAYLKPWVDFPIVAWLEERFGLPACVENDGVAAAWGEYRAGAAQGYASMLQVTLGTGIGGGAVLDGQRLPGSVGSGAAFGHMCIDINGPPCVCGHQGCWELYASGVALEQAAARAVAATPSATLLGAHPTGPEITAAARAGDLLAQRVLAATGRYLGVGLVNLANLFNPEVIVIGGGLAQAGNYLLEPARAWLERKRLRMRPVVEVRLAQLGAVSGVVGAALLCYETGGKRYLNRVSQST